MGREEVFAKLTDIFRDNFEDDTIELSDATSADDISGWDSMEQVNLLVIIQGKFNISFNIDEVNAMKNVGEMADYILQKVNGAS